MRVLRQCAVIIWVILVLVFHRNRFLLRIGALPFLFQIGIWVIIFASFRNFAANAAKLFRRGCVLAVSRFDNFLAILSFVRIAPVAGCCRRAYYFEFVVGGFRSFFAWHVFQIWTFIIGILMLGALRVARLFQIFIWILNGSGHRRTGGVYCITWLLLLILLPRR